MFDPLNPTPDDSIYAVVAAPERYDGREVCIVGYFDHGLEYAILYPHEADARLGITANGIWVRVPDDFWRREGGVSKGYSVVTGVIEAVPYPRAAPACWCSIRVTNCRVWTPPGVPAEPHAAADRGLDSDT